MDLYRKEQISYKDKKITIEGVKDYYNKRVIIEDTTGDPHSILEKIKTFINESFVEKVIYKAPKEMLLPCIKHQFVLEAYAPKYCMGEDRYFLALYKTQERYNSPHYLKEDEIINKVKTKVIEKEVGQLKDYEIVKASKGDAEQLAYLYKQVFTMYPVPIFNPSYIINQMENNTIFYYVKEGNGEIIAAASADLNVQGKSAEITDCATLPNSRKGGFMKYIITVLEDELKHREITCVYSIARSLSFGMNAVLHQLGYTYTGRLRNNCFIYDKMEDMNMWVKEL